MISWNTETVKQWNRETVKQKHITRRKDASSITTDYVTPCNCISMLYIVLTPSSIIYQSSDATICPHTTDEDSICDHERALTLHHPLHVISYHITSHYITPHHTTQNRLGTDCEQTRTDQVSASFVFVLHGGRADITNFFLYARHINE
jgi:hypothetical protein